ncbi:AAA family ATPase [Enterococcus hirae]|uniref:ATP-binding protein n=1 Tax=Enterococcus TaxID=1350 RepID=UPI00159A6079|nr:ATP-binding protein [Enterococcus hirae]EMF0260296.1 AAA family ATPase [Enterococcus hirae]MBA5272343.1 AAA family ATPase [Enterococcus hirae]MDU1933301.1 ATP-binding protein [Enterococcus hirae]QKX70721.1 AAA family ATPase [Enterococcus hirae]
MKKKNILNLIKYHAEKNDLQFREEAIGIARYFDTIGDHQLSEYIMSLLSSTNTFVPQNELFESLFFKEIKLNAEPLPLPEQIADDIKGIINAVNHNIGINKFLFEGSPGTGKTETVKQVARLLDRKLYMIEFSELIDSKMGQTAKNVVTVFNEINRIPFPSKIVILFDEIDAIALDRVNTNDLREMGRVTSTILKELDKLNEEVVLIATTNLYENFDKALVRRFDTVIDFNRYEKEDLLEIAEIILNDLLKKFKNSGRDIKIFRKIISNMKEIPNPGELKNLIKISLAFSDPNNEFDYLRRLLNSTQKFPNVIGTKELKRLQSLGFTVREIEILTDISKSQVSRELKGE